MRIVCLGWGSLIWKPGVLSLCEKDQPWHRDGPELPIEFARQSRNGRITLVIIEKGCVVETLWADLKCPDLAAARANLTEREWPKTGDPKVVVGVWCRTASEASLHSDRIGKWASTRGFDAVVWTKLPPKFKMIDGQLPSEIEIVQHLQSLSGHDADCAEAYVRRTPKQIATPYRKVIEDIFGWTYDGRLTDPNIR